MVISTADITALLRAEYPATPRSQLHPTDGLIATILSQHTADRNSRPAFAALKARYPTWEALEAAPIEDVADTIRSAGLAHQKAARIHEILAILRERYGSMDLNFLRALPPHEALALLRSLPGVGPKTASCVLLFSCDMPVLPVDTHVHRLARRLGLISDRTNAEDAHRLLAPLVEPENVLAFHVGLIQHGRAVCRAGSPRCEMCILRPHCHYGYSGA